MHAPLNVQPLSDACASANGTVTVRIASSLEAVEGSWRAFESSVYCSRFQSYDWLDGYLKAGALLPGSEIAVAVVSSHNKLRMIVPFVIEHLRAGSRLCWLGHDVNDYNAPIIDLAWALGLTGDDMRSIWGRILAALPQVDYVHIQRQPTLLGNCPNPFTHLARTPDTCHAYAIAVDGSWRETYARLRSTKSRRRLREKMKRLGKSGRVRLRRIRQPGEQREVLKRMVAWKDRQLKASGDSNPFSDGAFERFLISAQDTSGPHGALRLFVLEVGDVVAAAALCLAGRDDMNLFITAHDPETFQKCSVGTLMMVKLMELTARSGRSVFDLSCGAEPYKRDWNVAVMDMFVTQWPVSARGYVMSIMERARLAAIKWTKNRQWAINFVQSLRRNWSHIRTNQTAAMPPRDGPAGKAAEGLELALDGARALHCALYERLTSRHLMQ